MNLNHPLMKTLKIVNSISGKTLEASDLKRHREALELAGKIAAVKGGIEVSGFEANGVSCEAVTPENAHNPNYAIIYAHGGGYVSGNLSYARILAAKLAISTGFTTCSFDYRLAPEHPYPAALMDSLAVWSYLTDKRYLPDHILFAGESAGGNLVLGLTRYLHEHHHTLPRLLLLFSPWTDMAATGASYDIYAEKDPILTRDYVTGAAKAYISGAGRADDERFSPLFADLSGFPPALIMAGRNEILLDDSIRLRDKLRDSGGDAVLDIEENGWHVYQQFPVPAAARAMKRVSAYVSENIYGVMPWKITGTD